MKAKELLEGSYRTEADFENAVDYAIQNCSDYIRAFQEPAVWRGSSSQFQYNVVNPRAYGRTSAHTSNEYTTIVSNDPAWAGYPKRSESLICSLDQSIAEGYGSTYAIILPNTFRMGICPTVDIWASFPYLKAQTGLRYASAFNEELREILELPYSGQHITDLGEIKSGLLAIEKRIKALKKTDYSLEGKAPQNQLYSYLFKHIKLESPNGHSYTLISDLLNPKKNRFGMATTVDSLTDYAGDDSEVWTDSTVLMVHEDNYTELRTYALSILDQG
jgi:hypothetical protein